MKSVKYIGKLVFLIETITNTKALGAFADKPVVDCAKRMGFIKEKSKRFNNVGLFVFFLFICVCGFGQPSMIRLQMSGPNNALDETILYYQTGATPGFDSDYDAYKLSGPNPQPKIALKYDNILFQINGTEPIQDFFSIEVLTTTPQTGTYTIFASDYANMPYGTCIKLLDTYTGITTNIMQDNYVFVLSDTTTDPRFLLELSFMNLPFSEETIPATCQSVVGNFIVKGSNAGQWNYIWKNDSGDTIKTKLNTGESDTLNPTQPGNYEVFIEEVLGCGYNHKSFFIDSIVLPVASFNSVDTVLAESHGEFQALNNSSNATNYFWSFGDSTTSCTTTNGDHIYLSSGRFDVNLIAYNNTFGCSDTTTKSIVVLNNTNTIGLTDIKGQEGINWCSVGENVFLIQNKNKIKYQLCIMDLNGKIILQENHDSENKMIDLNVFNKGIYYVLLQSGSKIIRTTACFVY